MCNLSQIRGRKVLDSAMCVLQISSEEYKSTSKDPVAAFAEPIASHMNADHADSIVAMVKHYVGIAVAEAKIEGLDR